MSISLASRNAAIVNEMAAISAERNVPNTRERLRLARSSATSLSLALNWSRTVRNSSSRVSEKSAVCTSFAVSMIDSRKLNLHNASIYCDCTSAPILDWPLNTDNHRIILRVQYVKEIVSKRAQWRSHMQFPLRPFGALARSALLIRRDREAQTSRPFCQSPENQRLLSLVRFRKSRVQIDHLRPLKFVNIWSPIVSHFATITAMNSISRLRHLIPKQPSFYLQAQSLCHHTFASRVRWLRAVCLPDLTKSKQCQSALRQPTSDYARWF